LTVHDGFLTAFSGAKLHNRNAFDGFDHFFLFLCAITKGEKGIKKKEIYIGISFHPSNPSSAYPTHVWALWEPLPSRQMVPSRRFGGL